MPVSGGPYLSAACLCDKVLQEKDGVLSLIRLIDRWNVAGPTPEMGTQLIQTFIAVTFKSGTYRGAAQLTVTPISPSNSRLPSMSWPVFFEGDDERGCGIAIPIGFPVQEHGLYWFEVALSLQHLPAEVFTYIPMRIAYHHVTSMPSAG
jgi:hypothetical protein